MRHQFLMRGLALAFNLVSAVSFAQGPSIPPDLKRAMDSLDAVRAAGNGSEWSQLAAEDLAVSVKHVVHQAAS